MFLVVLFLALIGIDPRYTMSAEPGDKVVAEVFSRTSEAAADQARTLLGERDLRRELVREAGVDLAVMHKGEPNARERSLVMVVASENSQSDRWACRLTINQAGSNDNLPRATRWCLTFMNANNPTLDLSSPAPTGRNPSHQAGRVVSERGLFAH